MKYRNLLIILFSTVIILLSFSSCKGESDKPYKIGVSQCSGDTWREKVNLDLQMELLNHPDIDLDIRNADNSSVRQCEDVRYFIDNDYDLIILAPNESGPLTEVVAEAKSKGIPVVTFDRMIDSDDFTAHMEVDNYALGKGVVTYARSLGGGKKRILEIRGPESASPAQLRHEGFMDAVAKEPDMEVVSSVFGEWDNATSKRLTDSVMRIHPDINMVFGHTDHMASGASDALKEMGREDVDVIGIDGFADQGIRYVSEGRLTATFLYPTEGQRLLKLAIAVMKGEPYERINRVAPLSPIDISNADILLSQDTLLNSGTSKILLLNKKIDHELERYSTQKMLLWAFVAIVILLSGFVFVLLRGIHANRLHQQKLEENQRKLEENKRELEVKNEQLEDEKVKQERLYEQLSEATKSKLMFFTNVSHDLRTPLTLIAGPVEQVAADPTLSERGKSLMQLTKRNVGILRRLIDQILDFRKMESGKVELKLSETDFGKLLSGWTDSFREVARRRHIKLTITCETEPGCTLTTVAVDVEKMERIFFNLMSNAFKHTPDNGDIEVTCHLSPDTLTYSVKDNGSGIPGEEIGRIFDNFYQAEGANPKGSGIGLALTKAFVELHGGSITVRSEKGRGSEFTVTIPVRHTSEEREVSSHISREDIETELSPVVSNPSGFEQERPTLLVIDDNADIRNMISMQLGDEYNVIEATDGLSGLRTATKYVPDLILCDVMMPVMDGLECVRGLKEEISTSHIPVLMLTACSLDEQRVAGYEHGADAYLSKPFNLDVLKARCRNLLAGRKRIEELYGKGLRGDRDKKISAGRETPKIRTQAVYRPNDVESEFYSKFASIVESRLGDADMQVAEIASEMGLGQSQFTRKIKALTNYTPVELIRTMRLQKARTLLFSTERTVSEIAFAVGFTSLAYFSKCYKEEFRVSPSEAREGR